MPQGAVGGEQAPEPVARLRRGAEQVEQEADLRPLAGEVVPREAEAAQDLLLHLGAEEGQDYAQLVVVQGEEAPQPLERQVHAVPGREPQARLDAAPSCIQAKLQLLDPRQVLV